VLATSEIFKLPSAGEDGERLTVAEIQSFVENPSNHEPFLPAVPLGLADVAPRIPADNPMTRAKVELGRQLYFDPRVSRDATIACATCHDPQKGWAEHTPVSTGIDNQKGGRNSPTVMNRAYGETQFWDGRAHTLEEQALGPIQNPIEMGFQQGELDKVVARLKEIEGYRIQFEALFGDVTSEGIAQALASFERTVLVGGSPYDYAQEYKRFEGLDERDLADDPELAAEYEAAKQGAEAHPMSESARRGQELFFSKRVGCSLCHVGANLTSEEFFNIGVGMGAEHPDLGRLKVTNDGKDQGAFKTPTLRNVASTAPYMHDGSQKTLEEVVEFYAKGGHPNDYLHERIKKIDLNEQEKADLVAFLRDGLTSPLLEIPTPRLP
jgi:cytochrome c peroxidase